VLLASRIVADPLFAADPHGCCCPSSGASPLSSSTLDSGGALEIGSTTGKAQPFEVWLAAAVGTRLAS